MSTSQLLSKTKLTADIYGKDFILLKSTSSAVPLHLLSKAIYEAQLDFVDEVIGTEVEICLKLNSHYSTTSLRQIDNIKIADSNSSMNYKLPIILKEKEGDWMLIKAHTGLSPKAYLDQLIPCDFHLSMLGFLPGFLYLKGLPTHLQVPRKTSPAKTVPAGTIAIGGPYLGCYSLTSPGGWNVIAHCPLKLTNNTKLPFVDMSIGDRVQLQLITNNTASALSNNPLTLKEYNELL